MPQMEFNTMKTFWAQFTRDGDYEENIAANKRIEEVINVIVNAESREQAIELLLESYPNTYHKMGQDKIAAQAAAMGGVKRFFRPAHYFIIGFVHHG